MKPEQDERIFMIIIGIIAIYAIVVGFAGYLYLLHKISSLMLLFVVGIFTIIYIPRLWILYEIKKADKLKVIEDFFMINGVGINFSDIKNFGVREYKPQVIFFLNNKMIVYQKADFCLETEKENVEFTLIGSEKIKLMKEFLRRIANL